MILVFLGSWRSTLIIAVSIPLSILTSIIILSAIGETINIMTLGGLALAVGILVDDATVEIENINRNLAQGKEIIQAILDGAQQIAVPAFVSTLSICIVFVPMFFLTGVARYLFVPLAEAVVFAMLASYLLSRTLVPTMARFLLKAHEEESAEKSLASRNPLVRAQGYFELHFERFRNGYRRLLQQCLAHRILFPLGFLALCACSFALLPWIGEDFFPAVDAGQIKLHLRAPTATRIEETSALCDDVERVIHNEIPANEIESVIDNIGLPYSAYNLTYSTSAPIGPEDADIMISLAQNHRPTDEYIHDLRLRLAKEFPGVLFYFPPADIVSQILNFGLPAPIDIQIVGRDVDANHDFANMLMKQLSSVTGIADLRVQQPFNQPKLRIDVDRTKTIQAGMTQKDVAGNLLVSLSGSFQTSPSFWLDPVSGVSYTVATQSPQYNFQSLQDIANIPVNGSTHAPWQMLANLGSITRGVGLATVSHYNAQTVLDIFGSTQGRDLGGVARDVQAIVDKNRATFGRAGICHSSDLLADRREFSIVARSADHHLGAACGSCGDCVDAVHHAHNYQRAGVDRFDHVHGRGHGKQHSRGELCERTDRGGNGSNPRGGRIRVHPFSARDHDGDGHDYRHGAAGARTRRRRRAECAAGTRRHWRIVSGDGGHAFLRSGGIQPDSWFAERSR